MSGDECDNGGAHIPPHPLNSPVIYLRAGPETRVNASGTPSPRTLGKKKKKELASTVVIPNQGPRWPSLNETVGLF